jgi:V/A-type H+-transporting ATPase subunit E
MPMNGIDKVAARIVSDARQEASALKAETEARAAELKESADKHAAELRQTLVAEGDAEAEKQYALLVSAAETEGRKETLRVKQELLSEAFDRAVLYLRNMDGDRYVKLLASLAQKASETGEEEIILNPEDRAKYGDALLKALKSAGSRLTLSEETRPIIGGLILSQGRIEMNCALDTLAALHRSELAGEAAGLLFD